MAQYTFETHYGHSSLADNETGIVIDWSNGDFNGSQRVHTEGAILPEENPELYIARKMREMGDYIAQNYPELI